MASGIGLAMRILTRSGRLLFYCLLIFVAVYVLLPSYPGMKPWNVRQVDADAPNGANFYASLAERVPAEALKLRNEARQSEHPYRSWYSKPGWQDRLAAWRFPDARSCLERNEQSRSEPDLTRFNWSGLWTEAEVEVCVFRVLTAISSRDHAHYWFISQNINAEPASAPRKRDGLRMMSAGRLMSADVPPKWPTYGLRRWLHWTAWSESFSVTLDEQGRPRSVEYAIITK